MTRRELQIGRLVLRVPRAQAPVRADEARALAHGIAAGVAPGALASRQRVAVQVRRRPDMSQEELVRSATHSLTRALR